MNQREWRATDYYAVLGVQPGATSAQIKTAYRTMARKHHPDANPGDGGAEERFKRLLQAYSVLSSVTDRAQYDRVRAGEPPVPAVRANGFAKYRAGPTVRRPTTGPPRRGRDVYAEVVLTRQEARQGRLIRIKCRDTYRPTRTAVVFLRPGVADGERLYFKGKGCFGFNAGDLGDLYLDIKILPGRWWAAKPGPRRWQDGMAQVPPGWISRAAFKILVGHRDP